MVDGFTVTAADTAENQAEYPQNPKQKEGFTYWLLAECRRRGVHVVMRNHPLREDSLAATRRLVKGQCIATWNRPQRPEWMDETTYEMMPASIEVRLVESINEQPGQRTEKLTIAMTLLDHKLYDAAWLAGIYRGRWHAEVYQAECTSSARLYQLAA